MENQSLKPITWLVALAAVAVIVSVSGVGQGLSRLASGMTPAVAPPPPPAGQYTECFAAKLWTANGDEVSAGRIPKTVKIPPGWVVVGGTTTAMGAGTTPLPAAVVCRVPLAPSAPEVLPPADPIGRCSAPEVGEMQQAGMSKSAIERACKL